MPELETTDGKPVDTAALDPAAINAKFGAAMNDTGPDEQAPPPRQPRAAAPAAEAPAKRRGRPPKEDRARTVAQAPAAAIKDDYAEDAGNLVGSVWTVAASIPYTQPYALVIEANSDALAASLAEGAKYNATIRGWVSAGQSSWMLGLASVTLTMTMQAWSLARDPEMRDEAAEATRASLKKRLAEKGIVIPEAAPDGASVA